MNQEFRGAAPLRLTVSQVRVAASCPRIAYFDFTESRVRGTDTPIVTRIWKPSSETNHVALGSLFHQTVESFNQDVGASEPFWELMADRPSPERLAERILRHIYLNYLNRSRLFTASGVQQESFMRALDWYVSELAEILCHGQAAGLPIDELRDQLFGDQRRFVDVTFDVGPNGQAINVHGRLDYVFYDWRTTRRRIIDYKLTPADRPANDISQISLYALMHHVQHHTEPDVAVLYLHPRRVLEERTWDAIQTQRYQTYDFLASIGAWLQYDENSGTGLKPPGEPAYCDACPWQSQCTARLGPKHEGGWLTHWREAAESAQSGEDATAPPEPRITAAPLQDSASTAAESPQDLPAHGSREPALQVVPQDELFIGYWESEPAPVFISHDSLVTHALVAGAAGSGKTWLAKVILEEAIRCGGAVIAIDPQGDLVQFLKERDASELSASEREAYEQFHESVEVRVWTPGSSIAMRMSLDPLRLPDDSELSGIEDPQRRREEQEQLFLTSASSLVNLANIGGEQDSQQTLLLEILRRLSHREHGRVSLETVTNALDAPESIGLDEPDRLLRKVERGKLARKLRTFLHGPKSALFTKGTPMDMEQLVAASSPGKSPLNIIYLNHLIDEAQKQFVVSVIATEIYRWMITRSPESGPQVMFYLDEARDFLPAGNRKTPAKQPLRRLFSQGRKYRVGCAVAAQSPRSVEYEALSNCSMKLIGRLESQQDVERVREWFSRDGRAPEWLAGRKGAKAGSFLGRWPDMDLRHEGREFRSRMLFSQHSGAWSPDRLEAEWRARKP